MTRDARLVACLDIRRRTPALLDAQDKLPLIQDVSFRQPDAQVEYAYRYVPLTGQPTKAHCTARAGDMSFNGIGIPALFMGLSQVPVSDTDTDYVSRALGSLSHLPEVGLIRHLFSPVVALYTPGWDD